MNVVFLKHINKLRECRCHPDALLVLDSLISLHENFLYDKGEIVLFLRILSFVQIHEDCYERCLSVGGKQCHHLILYSLNSLLDFFSKPHFNQLITICV